MSRKLKFVEIHWDDAASSSEWRKRDELPTVMGCVTRGWLLYEDDNQVTLAATLQKVNDGEVGELISIPQGMVKKMKRLKV